MEKFDVVVSKLGEQALQAILENWERYQGIKPSPLHSLEIRWRRFLEETETCSSYDA